MKSNLMGEGVKRKRKKNRKEKPQSKIEN